MNRIKNCGFSHVVDLEERKDLLTVGDDPLSVTGPFESLNWENISHEIPDNIHISNITFINLKEIGKKAQGFYQGIEGTSNLKEFPGKTISMSQNEDFNPSDNLSDRLQFLNGPLIEGKNNKSIMNLGSDWSCNLKKKDSFGFIGKHTACPSHVCSICKKSLSSKGSLRIHMYKRHKVKLQFSCNLCSKKFDLQRGLFIHRNNQHKSKDGKFYCNKCNQSIIGYQNFMIHLKDHRNRKSECSKEVVNENYCDEIEKGYEKDKDLNKKMLQCRATKGKLKQKKSFTCETCGKHFAFGCLLRDHINLHTGRKPYLCQTCGKCFSQRASLKQHNRTHNPVKPHKCPECPQGFFGKGDLKKHLRKHTGERPYVCEICGEGFSQSSHLGVHRRSHTGEKPFKCDICGRGFTKKGDVLRHCRIHTGELPYLCEVCGKAFRQLTQCSNHIKNHHPESPVSVIKNPKPTITT